MTESRPSMLDALSYQPNEQGLLSWLEYQRDEYTVSDVIFSSIRAIACSRARFFAYRETEGQEVRALLKSWLAVLEKRYSAPGPLQERWKEDKSIDFALKSSSPGIGGTGGTGGIGGTGGTGGIGGTDRTGGTGTVVRVHLWQHEGLNASCRVQPMRPPTLEDILPLRSEREQSIRTDLEDIFSEPQGLVIIGGKVRSGKTWLENAFFDHINNRTVDPANKAHIWIIGDPPEFQHQDKSAFFTTIDIATRGTSQEKEIRQSLRVPKNIMSVGEMRGDTESTEAAIMASLAGTLVTATGHFAGLGDAVNRFSLGSSRMSEESKRSLLSGAVAGIINLSLIPGISGNEELLVEYINVAKNQAARTDLRKNPDAFGGQIGTREHARSKDADAESLLSQNRINEETFYAIKRNAI